MIHQSQMKTSMSIDCSNCCSRAHSIFCELSDKKMQFLKDYKVTRSYDKHEIIFREGEKPTGLFCMFSGLAKIYKTSENGKEQIVRLAKESDLLGYRSFFSEDVYRASAQAISESTICFVDRRGIEKLVKNSPEVIFSLLKKLCNELGESEKKFQDLLAKSVEERLAYFLQFFLKNSGSRKINLPLSREEIASIIGARPETVIRILSAWKHRGLISIKAKSVTVLSPTALFH